MYLKGEVKKYMSSAFAHAIALERETLKEIKQHIEMIKQGEQVPQVAQNDDQRPKRKGAEQRYAPLFIFHTYTW